MPEFMRACVIGWPIRHSRSPLIHRFWLKEYGVKGDYEKIPVKPEELEEFLAGLAVNGLRGCNVTIPHKERAYEIVARANPSGVNPMGRRLKAVNTIWLDEKGRLCADNTDVHGFMANFRQRQPQWRAKDQAVTVLGAGGAARAIVAGFIDAGVKSVTVVNRTREKAKALAAEMGPPAAAGLDALPALLEKTDVFVNATSLGMTGQPPLSVPLEALPAHAIVADIVYAPLQTDLLRAAARRGLKTVDGLGMLLHQAAPGFEKWFGPRPEVTRDLRELIERDLEGA